MINQELFQMLKDLGFDISHTERRLYNCVNEDGTSSQCICRSAHYNTMDQLVDSLPFKRKILINELVGGHPDIAGREGVYITYGVTNIPACHTPSPPPEVIHPRLITNAIMELEI